MLYRCLIAATLALGSAGCSTLVIDRDFDPEYDFASLRTYAWMPDPQPETGDPRIDRNELLFQRIDRAVDRVLAEKGYRETSAEEADFLVGYYLTLEQKVDARVVNDYYGWAPTWGYWGPYPYGPRSRSETYIYEYDQGTLILDVADAEKRKLIWRGTATDEVNFQSSPEEKEKAVNTAVEKILEGFPAAGQGMDGTGARSGGS